MKATITLKHTSRRHVGMSRSQVNPRHLPLLGRLMSGPIVRQLFHTGRSSFMAAAFKETGAVAAFGARASLIDVASQIFGLLRRHYRSDYVYRSAIATKIFLGRHSPTTTVLLPELRVWRSKADLVMLNGTSVAYEIKTALDNLDRLASQLSAYAQCFDRIYVVTDEQHLGRIRDISPRFVGLKVLTRAFTLRTEREALSNADRVSASTVVDALRRPEVVRLTQRLCGSIPKATPVQLFDACSRALADVKPRALHDEMVSILKERRNYSIDDFGTVPPEFVPAYLESGLRPSSWPAVTARLTSLNVRALIDGQ